LRGAAAAHLVLRCDGFDHLVLKRRLRRSGHVQLNVRSSAEGREASHSQALKGRGRGGSEQAGDVACEEGREGGGGR
jgi:uncharacterized membrane protein